MTHSFPVAASSPREMSAEAPAIQTLWPAIFPGITVFYLCTIDSVCAPRPSPQTGGSGSCFDLINNFNNIIQYVVQYLVAFSSLPENEGKGGGGTVETEEILFTILCVVWILLVTFPLYSK